MALGVRREFACPLTLGSVAVRCAIVLSLGQFGIVGGIFSRAIKGHHPSREASANHKLLVPSITHAAPAAAALHGELPDIRRITALVSAGHVGGHALVDMRASIPRSWALRLCNAYAYEGSVHVFHSVGRRAGINYTDSSDDGEAKLTQASGPLPFKRCADVSGVVLAAGSLLKFRIGGEMHVGTFFVERLPPDGSMLQLVLKRRDTWSTAADFSSHVFAKAPGSQIALVNAYLGSARSALEVRDAPTAFNSLKKGLDRQQQVQFGTVVDLAAGSYTWSLLDVSAPQRHAEKASVEFKAVDGTAYTILRVGADAIGGQSFPEELIVWPADGAVVRRGPTDSATNSKGLFGIPRDFSKSTQRSSAVKPSMRAMLVFVVAVIAVAPNRI